MNGIKVFSFNYALETYGGSSTVSSNDDKAWFPFDGRKWTRWISSGEDTDGNAISVERDFVVSRTLDSLYIYDTNIKDIAFWYWNGAAWVELATGVNCTITKSTDSAYIFVDFTASLSFTKFKITGSTTISANEEKYIGQIFIFMEVGTFTYPVNPNPRCKPVQTKHQLDNGKYFVIDKGEYWEFSLTFKSHVNQADITIAETLKERKSEFYIWLNGGSESQFTYSFAPFRFKDIFKVVISDSYSPEFTKNYYKSGLNDVIKLIEVE